MKKIVISICCLLLITPFLGLAEETNTNSDQTETVPFKAVAGKDRNVAVGRKVLFNASSSTCPNNCALTYDWQFGDESTSTEVDTAHVYNTPGVYRVSLTVSDGISSDTDEIIVSVEKDINLLINDVSTNEDQLETLKSFSSQQKVLLTSVRTKETNSINAIQDLTQQLLQAIEDVKQSEIIIVKTNDNNGMNALSDLAKSYANEKDFKELGFSQKAIVVLTSKGVAATSRIAQSTFDVLRPQLFVITSDNALLSMAQTSSEADIIPNLKKNNFDYRIIGTHTARTLNKITPWNFMSYLTTYLVNKGVALDTIYLILILPVIATIIAFARQLIGLKAFGIYIPSIVALTFVATGLKYGLAIFVTILIVGTVARILAKRIKLLYLPRMAIVVILVSLTIFGCFVIGAYTNRTGFIAISIFPILILTMLTESFVGAQIEKGFRGALRLTIETLVLSIISYFIVTMESFKFFILAYPEVILLTLVINIFIGRFTGLRLLEYFRFKNVIKNLQQPEKK